MRQNLQSIFIKEIFSINVYNSLKYLSHPIAGFFFMIIEAGASVKESVDKRFLFLLQDNILILTVYSLLYNFLFVLEKERSPFVIANEKYIHNLINPFAFMVASRQHV